MKTLDKIGKPFTLRSKRVIEATPCAVELSTLFNCWRAIGVDASQCATTAKALVACMSKRVFFLFYNPYRVPCLKRRN